MCNELPDAELAPLSQDTLMLLIGAREERRRHERAIKLFQYKVWTLYPACAGRAQVNSAGFIAGMRLILDNPPGPHEDDVVTELRMLRREEWFEWGPFRQFDEMNATRAVQSGDVVGVVDFLVRHTFYERNRRTRKLDRALWFEIERRKKEGGRPITPRTIENRLRDLRTNSIFAYLREKQTLEQPERSFLPPRCRDADFTQRLINDAADVDHTRSVFGAYMEVRGILSKPPSHLEFLREHCKAPALEIPRFTSEEDLLIRSYRPADMVA